MFNFTGGMLTGDEIERQIKKGRIEISPYDATQLNPNSYNLRLHPQLLIYKRGSDRSELIPEKAVNANSEVEDAFSANDIVTTINKLDVLNNISTVASAKLDPIDMNKPNETIEFEIPEEGYVLQPGVLYIGRTIERTSSDYYIPMINGRSSGGRLGISIHICAGFGDVGFDGTWTLEITCVEPVRIYPNTEIAQVCYFKPCGKLGRLYRGRYFMQEDATASRFYQPKKDQLKRR